MDRLWHVEILQSGSAKGAAIVGKGQRSNPIYTMTAAHKILSQDIGESFTELWEQSDYPRDRLSMDSRPQLGVTVS